jgi:RNA polymerase sigma-70 factor (ECF subfamily)
MVAAVDLLTRLAHNARGGDSRALEVFVENSYDQVWRLCASLVGDENADDLSQETFAQAVRALPRFRGESSARTWLFAIARHICLDELRARSRRRCREGPMSSDQGATATDPSGALPLAELIGALDLDRRTAFVLTQVLGLSYAEAARVCACPLGTIRSRVARARAELVALLKRSDQDGGHRRSSLG